MFQKFGQDVPQSLVDAVAGIMEAKHDEPAAPDAEAIARRKRLQALKDKQEDDAAERGETAKQTSNVRVHKGTYGTSYKDDIDESLKGNQHKIDANKNGKIDADDFKKLRADKKDEACDCKEETELDETAYSAKAARAGKDIGKPGKNFAKIAAKAGKKYGSAEKGKKVAGAVLAKIRAKHMGEEVEDLEEKAVSQAQQKFMGMVYAAKKGGKAASPAVAKAASGMTKKAAHDYAATKHKGLPQHSEEVEIQEELILDLREDKDNTDLPFTPDKPHGEIATPGKQGYGVSASRHLARMGLKKMLDNAKKKHETYMGKAGTTSEETEIEESRGHKIIATKLKQLNAKIDKMSSGIAPDTHTNPQSTKDKLKDAHNINNVEIVTQKDTSVKKEEVEIQETATLDQYIKSMGYDPLHMDKNKKVMFSKTNAFKQWAQRQESMYDGGQKGTQDIEADNVSPGATARG